MEKSAASYEKAGGRRTGVENRSVRMLIRNYSCVIYVLKLCGLCTKVVRIPTLVAGVVV